jgi:mannose-6-phosphate isomerase-like protein (cupin superfamily)
MSYTSKLFSPIFAEADNLSWRDPFPGEKVAIRVDSREIGGHFGIGEAIIDPMVGPPMHIHRDADEVLYVLEGTVDFECDGKRFRTGPGGLLVIPRGTPHTFRNFGAAPARLLGIFTPGGLERMFLAMDGRPLSEFPQVAAEFLVEIMGPPIEPIHGDSFALEPVGAQD